MCDSSRILSLLRACSVETCELSGSCVPVVDKPDSLVFLRDHVARSHPCLLTGVVPAWPASQAWLSDAYLLDKLGHLEFTVAVTPDGRADAVTGGCFAQPAEERLTLQQLFSQLDDPTRGVAYASAQNGSLSEFGPLACDVPPALDFATAAFGSSPDAVNIWLGSSASVTSFHADPYENVYAVLRGEKVFTLLPPGDAYRLYSQSWPATRYARRGDGWELEPETPARQVAWSPVDPHPADAVAAATLYPLFFDAALPAPLEVTVRAGEMLYLPALWHHHVRQRGERVIAVNYWHDMKYDSSFASQQLKLGLAQLVGPSDTGCSVLIPTHTL